MLGRVQREPAKFRTTARKATKTGRLQNDVIPVHFKILLTYLRLTNIKLGLLINFNEAYVKDDIKRMVNNL